jgi:uncharacterized OsmC-like protein
VETATILQTIELWKAQPDKALVQPAVTARADQRQAIIEAGPFAWRADLPPTLGGSNQAPSPTALLLGALAGCAVVFIRDTLGPLLSVPITDVKATARCRADFRGLLGLDGAAPNLADIELDVEVTSPSHERDIGGLTQAWIERCPIYLALTKPMTVATRFTFTRDRR